MTAAVALVGKHPSLGDFLCLGLAPDEAKRLTAWLDQTLHAAREELGEGWQAFWDAAQPLRFWLGRALIGRTAAGVLIPSRDKVGRRYPLLVMVVGAEVASPLADPDQGLFTAFERWLKDDHADTGLAAALPQISLAALGLEAESAAAGEAGPVLWAHRRDGDLQRLLTEAGPVDADRAATSRSYWWAPARGPRMAVWLGHPGMPSAPSLCWLLGGMAAEPERDPAPEPDPTSQVQDV